MTDQRDPLGSFQGDAFVISRTFDAPRELVFAAWTDAAHLVRWFGPEEAPITQCTMQARPGGVFHYKMADHWARWLIREIEPPNRLVFMVSFSDESGAAGTHPTMPDWPRETLSEVTFTDAAGGGTTVSVRLTPHDPTDAERRGFRDAAGGMSHGWTGTFDRFAVFLAAEPNPSGFTAQPMGDREIVMMRTFEAPRTLVWDAFTKPGAVKRWMYGPDGHSMPTCEMALRPGGSMRCVWRMPDGAEMGLRGEYQEIEPPERIVHTEVFDEDWTGGPTRVTTIFAEHAGRTTVSMTIRYASTQIRDDVLGSGMAEGVGASFERLAAMLTEAASA